MTSPVSTRAQRRYSPRQLILVGIGTFAVAAACAIPLTATAASNAVADAAAAEASQTAVADARSVAGNAERAVADVQRLGVDGGESLAGADTKTLRARISTATVTTADGGALSEKQTHSLTGETASVRAATKQLRLAVVQAEATAANAVVQTAKDAKAAEAAKAVADAAAAAAAVQAAKDAEAAAAALAQVNTVEGAKDAARTMAQEKYGWGEGEFGCLDQLWTKESGWDYQAENASSGAFGIPQSLPGSKMATIADDWADNAATQIAWGLGYIDAVYGTPCAAWGHSQSTDWY